MFWILSGIVVIGVFSCSTNESDLWESENRARITELCEAAEGAMSIQTGFENLKTDKCNDLLTFVGYREIKDETLARRIDAIRIAHSERTGAKNREQIQAQDEIEVPPTPSGPHAGVPRPGPRDYTDPNPSQQQWSEWISNNDLDYKRQTYVQIYVTLESCRRRGASVDEQDRIDERQLGQLAKKRSVSTKFLKAVIFKAALEQWRPALE